VKNEYNTTRRFSYDVLIEDINGKAIKSIVGEEQALAAGEVRT